MSGVRTAGFRFTLRTITRQIASNPVFAQPSTYYLRAARSYSHLMAVPHDVRMFLDGYPDRPDNSSRTANLRFYKNERPMQPEGLLYDDFMRQYGRDYYELEANHGYIQWLFPIPEQGMNHRAQPLQLHEQTLMAADPEILDRLLKSYIMIMAFYGIRVDPAEHHGLSLTSDYKDRLRNLSQRPHNLLRLTRILKLLGLFPTLAPLAAPLVLFFTALHGEGHLDLSPSRMHGGSLDRWWVNCLRDEGERKEVTEIARGRGGFGKGKWVLEDWNAWFEKRTGGASSQD